MRHLVTPKGIVCGAPHDGTVEITARPGAADCPQCAQVIGELLFASGPGPMGDPDVVVLNAAHAIASKGHAVDVALGDEAPPQPFPRISR